MSHDTFRIGEIAIYTRPGSPYNGSEVMVVGPLLPRVGDDLLTGNLYVEYDGYQITLNELPGIYGARPEWLRKRRPPQDWMKLCNLADVPREVEHV